MKRIVILALILLPLLSAGQRLSEEQSRQRIEQLRHLLQHYKPHYPREFEFHADCGFAVITDSTDWQRLVALDGTELLSRKYIFYRQIVDGRYSPYFLVLSEDEMGLIDTVQWVVPMECEHDGTCTAGCYDPYMHHWLEEGHPCLRSIKRRLRELDREGWMPVERPQDSASRLAISGPYQSLIPVTDDLFEFFTGNPGDRSDQLFGYVDLYGNTTATPAQLATMEKWLSGVIEYDVEPIPVTSIEKSSQARNRYATVYTCLSHNDTMGYLLVPKDDTASSATFNRCVSVDPWGDAVEISHKRYEAVLSDVQQAEALLPEVLKEGVFPKLGRWRHYIGNPDNYRKYERTYGFYYNEKGERCVYIQMDLDRTPPEYIGFSIMWDACDAVVYLNLNLDTRQVIRAYASSCQSY